MPRAQTLNDLQRHFSIPNVVRFEDGPGGLILAAVTNAHAAATIYLHGAHVAHYQPTGHRPVLFMSGKSAFAHDKPIRGGVPIVFPWFGPRGGDPSAPLHGFARLMEWTVDSATQEPDGTTTLVFVLTDDETTRRIWPSPFALRYAVTIGPSLELALEVRNPTGQPMTFEEALHTYFTVADVRQAGVSGLAGATYVDKMDSFARKVQDEQPIRIVAETDRVYLNTAAATTTIDDPAGGRRIVIGKEGSRTTVVWNPWIAKAKAMADFGDEEWPEMLCVETANAGENAITLAPDQSHRMAARIRCTR